VNAPGWNRPDKLPSLLANGQSAPIAVLLDFVSDLMAEEHDIDFADRAGVQVACAFAEGTFRARWNADPLDVIGWIGAGALASGRYGAVQRGRRDLCGDVQP